MVKPLWIELTRFAESVEKTFEGQSRSLEVTLSDKVSMIPVEHLYSQLHAPPTTRYFLVAIARAVHTMFYVQ